MRLKSVIFWSSAPVLSWNSTSGYINLNKNFNVQGDISLSGTVDGIDIATDVAANTLKNTNVTTDLSATANGSSLSVNSSDGANASLPAATTTAWGVMTNAMFDSLAAAQNSTQVATAIETYTKILTVTGNDSTTSFDLVHDFDTRYVAVEILDFGNNGSGATYATVHADVTREADTYVTIDFAVAPASTQDYKVMLRKIV